MICVTAAASAGMYLVRGNIVAPIADPAGDPDAYYLCEGARLPISRRRRRCALDDICRLCHRHLV